MPVLDEIISTLNFNVKINDIRQGVFLTGVVSRHCGLASTLPRDAFRQESLFVRAPGLLLESSAEKLVHLAYSNRILEAAIGMATLNSLLDVNEQETVSLNAADLILHKGAGKKVAIVGHFPFVQKVRDAAKRLWILEKNPQKGDFPDTQADKYIPQADVVAITGTSLTNHTFEDLLKLCSSKAYVVVLGPSTPLSSVFFDYGVAAVSGTRVIDPEKTLKGVSQGANFRQIDGVKRLTMMRSC